MYLTEGTIVVAAVDGFCLAGVSRSLAGTETGAGRGREAGEEIGTGQRLGVIVGGVGAGAGGAGGRVCVTAGIAEETVGRKR